MSVAVRSALVAICVVALFPASGCGGGSSSGTDGGVTGSGGGGATGSGGTSDGATGSGGAADGAIGSGGSGTDGPTGSGGAGGALCYDKCQKDISQCLGAKVQKCTVQANGCTDWAPAQDCPNNKACNGGSCPTCADACTYGNTQCLGTQVQKCVTLPSGCTGWDTATGCPYGKACTGGACPDCVDACVKDQTKCNGVQLQTCTVQANGCTDWSAPSTCSNGKTCVSNACPTCLDQCTLNNTQCSGTLVQKCELQTSGCTAWGVASACSNGKACLAGSNACPSCTDACTLNDTKCSGAQTQTCQMQANGCTAWSTAANCPTNQSCQGKVCVGVCSTGQQRCNGTILEGCNSSHQWATQQVCSQACDDSGAVAQCVGSVACTANSRRCTGSMAQVCNSTGTAWLSIQNCGSGCSDGLCTGLCSPGDKRCNGNVPESCNTAGNAWTVGTACATSCWKGDCAQPSLTIDANANATLDGEQVFDGDVVIKNASVLTVASGKLIIRAKTVTLDATSKIVIQPIGDDPRGRGVNSAASIYCSTTGYYLSTSASGGGFGTVGVASSGCAPGYSSCYCGWNHAGGLAYAVADDELATGSRGGQCDTTPGGLGGGYLAIYADTIVIQGQVTALGASGTGCSGGGSGGEVLLRANDLSFTGSISTAGGNGGTSGSTSGGKGGDGVVKLLYGGASTLTGTVTGAKFASFMPPFDISSSTHPRQDRCYNDGFPSLDLAWSKPFPNGAGYYQKLNTTYAFLPAPANATYLAGESISFPAGALTSNGLNYLHVTTFGPFSNVGTAEARYTVKVNSYPPSISSSSHPSQTTWYTNDSPFFSWTQPTAPGSNAPIPDDDVAGFYWVWDHFKETVPGTGDNWIPMDPVTPANSKQIMLPGNSSGIWFFHLVAKDTMGYLTKSAATFQVQIGTAPITLGSVSGAVNNAGTTAVISGASITLNRGVFNGTSTGTGTYSIQNVVPGTYEIRARANGFRDATNTVTVTAGQTSTVNFNLTPAP